MKISRKLKNVVVIEGQKEKVAYLNENLRKEFSVLSVKVPKKMEKIDSSFIDRNWVAKKIENSIFYGKLGNTSFYVFIEDKALEKKFIKSIKTLEIEATYTKIKTDESNNEIIKQRYLQGEKVEKEINNVKSSRYSVANVFC